jgi:hypothetical protein
MIELKEYVQPSIEILGIRVDEPVTSLTDLAVSTVCFYAFARLSRLNIRNKVQLFLKYYFLSMGLATAIGGIIGHAFFYHFSFYWKLPAWLTSMVSVALLERAAIEYARPIIRPSVGRFFGWINIIELVTFMAITFTTLNFFFVELHVVYGFGVVVLGFSLFVYRKTRAPGAFKFILAIASAGGAMLFYTTKWGFGPWFIHLDISHSFMTLSAYWFYRGAMDVVKEPIG